LKPTLGHHRTKKVGKPKVGGEGATRAPRLEASILTDSAPLFSQVDGLAVVDLLAGLFPSVK
jgi:hypothetical protein